MDYDRYDAFLHHIFKQTQGDAWFRPSEDNLSAGVALRVDHGEYDFPNAPCDFYLGLEFVFHFCFASLDECAQCA